MTERFVSVIIPCRNEERHIRTVLDDLIAQDFPKVNLEVIFGDGESTDKTRETISEYSRQYPWIKQFNNPKRTVPFAMNEGIRMAKGDTIIRMDAHASFPPDYISKLVNWQEKLNADNVGGVWITKPSSSSLKAEAIAEVLSHPLGVGNSMFRIGVKDVVESDTVPFGCYRKQVFDRIGYYDERLERNQDIELNKRLKASGGKIYLVPDVSCTYYARDTYYKLAENNFRNGEWVILTSYYTGQLGSLSIRHFVPLGFLLYLLSLPFLAMISSYFKLPLVFYLAAIAMVSMMIAFKRKKPLYMPALIYGFLILHVSYGAGCLWGLWRLLIRKV
ncbi:MAG: glycosyltransferase family 2 protein [Bacteroidetes bacterium]|nr:glycosyltransferase family 2 protein [Bacteroidota bacterium]